MGERRPDALLGFAARMTTAGARVGAGRIGRLVRLDRNHAAASQFRPIPLTSVDFLSACRLLTRQVVDPILRTRVRTVLWSLGHRGPQRIQIEIRGASQQRRFVKW